MPTQEFSPRKFARMPLEGRHRKCARALRHIVEGSSEKRSSWINYYNRMAEELQLSCIRFESMNWKQVADRFHLHQKQVPEGIKEHRLLRVQSGDRSPEQALPFLPISLYLDNIRSAHNVGSILRSVEAMRLGSVHFSPGMISPSSKQLRDAAMGSERLVSLFPETDLSTLPRPIIALETVEGAANYRTFPFPARFTLVVGNEEYGCSDRSLQLADHFIQIPLQGCKNSLNVANAVAIVGAEIRQSLGQ